MATKTLTAQCFCKSVHFTISVPPSSLPLPVHLCHCSSCRYNYGTLCIFHAPLPAGVVPEFVAPSSLSSLTSYRHSPTIAATRHFCTTCGCHIGDVALEPDRETGKRKWTIATAIFESTSEDDFVIRRHIYTNSAPGGGVYDWLTHIGDRELEVWNPDPSQDSPPPLPEPEFGPAGDERLRAECHCGGVSFTLPRPTIPEVAGDPNVAALVSDDPNRWKGSVDLCDDCRLTSGNPIAAWTFVPPALADPPIGPDLRHGTLKTYKSSDDVLRAFCGVCGATVFYLVDDRVWSDTSFVVDVPVALLRAPEGVLAEKWIKWRSSRTAFYDSGEKYHPELARSLIKGLQEWAKRNPEKV